MSAEYPPRLRYNRNHYACYAYEDKLFFNSTVAVCHCKSYLCNDITRYGT